MMSVRLRRTAVVVAVLVAAWLLPALSDAAPRHRTPHAHQCKGTLDRAWSSNADNALDDVDDPDLGADRAPRASADRSTTVSNPDSAPSWPRVTRAADPRAARLIVWRKLDAPRPPPSL